MLSKLKVQHYKSLFDSEIDLEPLTVFIGPNGSGKSNICEALFVLSDFFQRITDVSSHNLGSDFFSQSLKAVNKKHLDIESKFWHRNLDFISIMASNRGKEHFRSAPIFDISVSFNYPQKKFFIAYGGRKIEELEDTKNSQSILRAWLDKVSYHISLISRDVSKICIYDFNPFNLSDEVSSTDSMERTGQGIAYALADILFSNRKSFDELEERLRSLVPNIQRISLLRGKNQTFSLQLVDKYSETPIPTSDISDGTLRILAFLTALYQEDAPSIICFEELENGVHPWLLHKMMELLKLVSTEGITGKPVQVLITTHSPTLLNYVEPHQVRAVELDNEGKTQVHNLPTDSVRFQKALEAYDGSLGELWFTNQFGGNPA
jgi:predicted ATPase